METAPAVMDVLGENSQASFHRATLTDCEDYLTKCGEKDATTLTGAWPLSAAI